jgi:hypothetical protein
MIGQHAVLALATYAQRVTPTQPISQFVDRSMEVGPSASSKSATANCRTITSSESWEFRRNMTLTSQTRS